MPNVYAGFEPMSFGGLEFPYETFSMKCSLRTFIHEYPHQAGGDPEKLGRKLYEVRVKPVLQAGLLPPKYADLFPGRMRELRRMFEDEESNDLVIPSVGKMLAYCEEWEEHHSAKIISGPESVNWVFFEDPSARFSLASVVLTNALKSRLSEWTIEADKLPVTPSIFDKILDAALQLLSMKDQSDLYGSLILAKADGLISLIQQADTQLGDLLDPDNIGLVSTLHRLLVSAIDLGRDVASKGHSLEVYTVAATMSIAQVSSAIYKGDTSKAMELLQNNNVDDPLAIPAGTKLVYYS